MALLKYAIASSDRPALRRFTPMLKKTSGSFTEAASMPASSSTPRSVIPPSRAAWAMMARICVLAGSASRTFCRCASASGYFLSWISEKPNCWWMVVASSGRRASSFSYSAWASAKRPAL
jgi:hypothetical protein